MKKIGRPKLDVTKNKVVTLRMSGEEYKRLRDYSEDHQQIPLKKEFSYCI